jgi:RNA polymerase sigma factor (sigma-70 family)
MGADNVGGGEEMRAVIRHLRAAALCCKGDGPSDSQLLEAFIIRREETAFEALVRRHGPMVLGVCRRVLRNMHDAEDAFQASFLVLARKAATVKPRDMVGNWLYGVAYRTAMKARAMNAKRRTKEQRSAKLPRSESSADEELLEQLDHELSRLPDKYRVPVVLCELEGRSRKDVARQLGVPEGTLSWRLAQAKKLLAKRLARQGATLSVGVLATALSKGLSPALRASTVKTVLSAGTIPAKVLALTEGVMKAMLLSKLKITVCAAALMLLAGVGATGVAYRAIAEEPRRTRTEDTIFQTRRSQPDDLDSLRLEIEALRKELRATRERVKALEEGMHGQKALNTRELPKQHQLDVEKRQHDVERFRDMMDKQIHSQIHSFRVKRDEGDVVSRAEAALKKLSENTDNKQAIEALEKALQRLKEQDKPAQENRAPRK